MVDIFSEQHVVQGIPDMHNNVHIWGFRWPLEVSTVRRVLLEPLHSNSRHVRCCIVLLEFQVHLNVQSTGMCVDDRTGYLCTHIPVCTVRVIFRCIRCLISLQLHTPHTITITETSPP